MPDDITHIEDSLKGRVFLVGGAVRDMALGREPKDRDYVVVGSTPEEMLELGFKIVGNDFPVFLHPATGDEYALARKERKVAAGYNGFEFYTSPDVTLEEDLARRDLTINAMAMGQDGEIIDPYNGLADLQSKTLRHVSDAFLEDPVRILRLARFAARYEGFAPADETLGLMIDMVDNGEVDALTSERVWQELKGSLTQSSPSRFFNVLRDCGALARVFPEIDRLFGIPQPEQHHPEVDSGIHAMMVLDMAAKLTSDPVAIFGALVHDLGKGVTPAEAWPSHHGHEEAGVPLVDAMCDRLNAPKDYRVAGKHSAKLHLKSHTSLEVKPRTILSLFNDLDAYRKPENLNRFLIACEADARGRGGMEERPYPQAAFLLKAYERTAAVTGKMVIADGYSGKEIPEKIREYRLRAISQLSGAIKSEVRRGVAINDAIANPPPPKERLSDNRSNLEKWAGRTQVVNEDGSLKVMYIGVNRTFDHFKWNKNRSVLNGQYQGDGFHFSPDPGVASKYAEASRNQCLDKEACFQALDERYPEVIATLFKDIVNEGYQKAWDNLGEDLENERWQAFREFDYSHPEIDINELFDLAEFVEGSHYHDMPGKGLDIEMVHAALFGGGYTYLPDFAFDDAVRYGLDDALPQFQVMPVYLRIENMLVTDDPEEARNAKENGYDGVKYNGPDCVDGVEEYIVYNPYQIKSAIGNSGEYARNSTSLTDQPSRVMKQDVSRYLDRMDRIEHTDDISMSKATSLSN